MKVIGLNEKALVGVVKVISSVKLFLPAGGTNAAEPE